MGNAFKRSGIVSAVLYARVSSKEQEEGYSISAQQKLLREYAGSNNIRIVRDFVDVETAKRAGRKCFGEMIQFLHENPEVEILLVEKTDRLYRNLKDWAVVEDLDRELHLVKEGQIMSRDSRSHEKFIHGIKALMAKNYIDNLSEETKKGMAEKVSQGGYPHHAPVGYRNDPATRSIVVDTEKASYVRKMFEWFAQGHVSLGEIRKRCIADGFKAGWGKAPISKSKVQLILKNPFYMGNFRWKGQVYEGVHEPIISVELFQEVQVVFADRGRRKSKHRSHTFQYGGLMTCGVCGCAVTAQRQKKKYVYYKCTNFHKTCDEGYYREADLESQFDELVQKIVLDDQTVEWVRGILKSSLADETTFHRENVQRLEKNLETVKDRLNRTYLDKLDGKISEEHWLDVSQTFQAEKEEITIALGNHLEADDCYLDEGVKILELSQNAYQLYRKQEPGEKRKLLRILLSNCILEDGRIHAEYNQPFDIIAEMHKKRSVQRTPLEGDSLTLKHWGE